MCTINILFNKMENNMKNRKSPEKRQKSRKMATIQKNGKTSQEKLSKTSQEKLRKMANKKNNFKVLKNESKINGRH